MEIDPPALSDGDDTLSTLPSWRYLPTKRRYIPTDEFFLLGDMERGLRFKYLTKPPAENTGTADSITMVIPAGAVEGGGRGGGGSGRLIQCRSGGCDLVFQSVSEYEEHYSSAHMNTCQTCRRPFTTRRMLELHIMETHDSLFSVMAEKQKMVCPSSISVLGGVSCPHLLRSTSSTASAGNSTSASLRDAFTGFLIHLAAGST